MAKTLQELQKENKRLVNEAESRKELVKIGEERLKLQEQNKKLLKQLRATPTNIAIRKTLGVTGRGLFKAGKSVGKGLIRYGNFLEEQERKNVKKSSKVKSRRR